MTEKEITARDLSDEDLKKGIVDLTEEQLRREQEQQERRSWVCIKCGYRMFYKHMIEGSFDEEGCTLCGHPEAIEIVEAQT